MALYLILEGVHRCVAAQRVGLAEVQARVDRGGVLGPVTGVPLADLYSPKSSISRWDRGRDFNALVQWMADATRRDALWPVVVSALPATRVKYFTRVADVVVTA